MFTDFGRKKVESLEETNFISFLNSKTHINEFWYLVRINNEWYGVNNSGKIFTKRSFKTKKELFKWFKSKRNINNIQMYCLNKEYFIVNGKSLFDNTLKFIKEEFEKQYKIAVTDISDCIILKNN